jgi:hypothetical protein
MKKRSARPGDRRDHERRFSERQTSRGEDDDNLATREGRPVRLPLPADSAEEVAEEVEGNALAEGITAAVDALRPHLRAILLGLAGLFLAAIGWMWARQEEAGRVEKSWDEYFAAVLLEDKAGLAEVASRHAGSLAGQWARLIQAEDELRTGAELVFVNRDESKKNLQTAADAYAGILSGVGRGLLAERATFGLAKANEGLGKLDDALQGYEAVYQDYPESAVADMARQRAAALKGNTAREWYTWFGDRKLTQPPAPPVDNSPILGIPAGDPPGAPPAPAGSGAASPAEPSPGAASASPPPAQE